MLVQEGLPSFDYDKDRTEKRPRGKKKIKGNSEGKKYHRENQIQ